MIKRWEGGKDVYFGKEIGEEVEKVKIFCHYQQTECGKYGRGIIQRLIETRDNAVEQDY